MEINYQVKKFNTWPRTPLRLSGAEAQHRSTESEALRFDSSWVLRTFFSALVTRWKYNSLIVTMRIWRSINRTLIRDLPLLTFLLPSYSSSSMSSSMSNMFIRHRTSVALLCRLADRSRPGICIWAGIMFIASGWRIKKGKKKNWTIWFKVFTLIHLINPSVCRSASSALLLYLPPYIIHVGLGSHTCSLNN